MAIEELPTIPENIVVHLGPPDSDAENITVPFLYYIKNVASSEIFPTWPASSIRANVFAIITFALNRVYNEWYRSKGYDFDITSSTAYDQKFIADREIYDNVGLIVDEIFDSYVRKEGTVGPYFTAFCNGTTVTCDGLSQWGTVSLAENGKNSFEILQNYYGNDIELVTDVPVKDPEFTYPGKPLALGDIGNDVARIELQLNRIADNYPALPKINVGGVYGPITQESVRKFQEIFNYEQTGIVDKSTWYAINYIFTSVKELGELSSEGIKYEDLFRPFDTELELGDKGFEVTSLQYYLNLIGNIYSEVDSTEITGIFDKKTEKSVKQFQTLVGLEPTGVAKLTTVRQLENIYEKILKSIPPETAELYPDLYPGFVLSLGSTDPNVTKIQKDLNLISQKDPTIPAVQVTGVYDDQTDRAVRVIQERYNYPITGAIESVTWYRIIQLYRSLI